MLVTGAGPVGLLAAQVARAFGAASVTVADLADFRLDMARGLGFETEKAGEGTRRDFDVLLECSGAPNALADGLWRLRFSSDDSSYCPLFGGHPSTDVTAEFRQRDAQPASADVSIGPYSVLVFSQDHWPV